MTKPNKEYIDEQLDLLEKIYEDINDYNSACAEIESAWEQLDGAFCEYGNITQEMKNQPDFEKAMKKRKLQWLKKDFPPDFGEQIKDEALQTLGRESPLALAVG